jgi:hypothetical protein
VLRDFYQTRQLNTGTRGKRLRQVNAMVQLASRLARLRAGSATPGLGVLLAAFGEFAREYAQMLDDANAQGDLSFLLQSGTDRLLQEFSILSRACEQRSEPSPKSMRAGEREESVRYYLEKADECLLSFCQRWCYAAPAASPYLPLQTPVVYFEKLYRISRALFAPAIPVVSIPLSDYDAPDNWQALAHEMGHHIFWNALDLDAFAGMQRKMRASVAKALLSKLGISDPTKATDLVRHRLDLWDSWLEEVFADVCGVLFAGPAFALSAQDLAAASVSKLTDLIGEQDEVHPCLYLRPLIALQVVREVAAASPSADYRQRLLEWAGVGEVETQRRAPGLEDQLRAKHAAQVGSAGSGKRLPADLEAVPESFPLATRWQFFAAAAAQQQHPAAGITLEELAGDVPIVVQTLLNTAFWPGDLRLWDLVDHHGRQAAEADLKELANLSWSALPSIDTPKHYPPIPAAVADPQSDFQRVLNRVVRGVEGAALEETEKPGIFWTLLASMNIEADAAGYHLHGYGVAAHSHAIPILGIQMIWDHEHPTRTTIDPAWPPF